MFRVCGGIDSIIVCADGAEEENFILQEVKELCVNLHSK